MFQGRRPTAEVEPNPGRLSYVYSIRDRAREVRRRPAMWLGSKTLTGLKSLLFGYAIACEKHGIPADDQLPDDVPWDGFTDWLKQRYGKELWSVDWHRVIVDHSASEEEAFDRFSALLDEYEGRV